MMEWNDVEKNAPPDDESVLVWTESGCIDPGLYHDHYWYIYSDHHWHPTNMKVKSWAALPAKPDSITSLYNIHCELGIMGGYCANCQNWVFISYKYCPFCGRKIK